MQNRRQKQPRRLLKQGGNRRRGDSVRQSWQLTEKQCRDLLAANEAAMVSGQPFNRAVTIIWGKFGMSDFDNRSLTEAWLGHARRWARSRGFTLRYVGVQEWGTVNKAHVHLLLHIAPKHLVEFGLRRLPSYWAKPLLGKRNTPGLCRTDQLYPPAKPESNNGTYENKLFPILHYMLKCAPSDLEAKLGVVGWSKAEWGQSCLCYGKRIFISQRHDKAPK